MRYRVLRDDVRTGSAKTRRERMDITDKQRAAA
jgi:hypothetical protein